MSISAGLQPQSEDTNPTLMTQAQYARHRNKSPQYIAKLVKAGITGGDPLMAEYKFKDSFEFIP